MKRILLLFIFINLIQASYAQVAKSDVQSLVDTENYFSSLAIEKGVKKAFLAVSDDETIVFRPLPVPAKDYYKKLKNDSTYLSWSPSFARISKSGDWGFTSGPYIFRPGKESASASYGQYLSIWRKNRAGVWKLVIDAGVPQPKPKTEAKLDFKTNTGRFFKQPSVVRQQQREDIITSTDKLFSLSLKVQGIDAYKEFGSENIHVLIPGIQPVIGKQNAIDFFNKQRARIISTTIAADRSRGGDYAYTYGKAELNTSNKSEEFYYIRLWQLSENHTWNVLFELFSPAGS